MSYGRAMWAHDSKSGNHRGVEMAEIRCITVVVCPGLDGKKAKTLKASIERAVTAENIRATVYQRFDMADDPAQPVTEMKGA